MVAPWISVDDLADQTVDDDLAKSAVEAASFVLFYLSGRKYGGIQTVTEEYCQVGLSQIGMQSYYGGTRPPLPGPNGYPMAYPELTNGAIINRVGGPCGSCGCTHMLRLRGGPVHSVQAVYHGEQEIPLSEVAIFDYSYITAPGGCWETCDNVEVTYTYGAPPPALGRIAAKALADQYILAMVGSEDCMLPQRVTQISRQGMSWTLLDPQDFLDKGRTGIYQVDLFLTTVNPDNAKLRARVFSPDLKRGKSYRWQTPQLIPASGAPQTMQMSVPTVTTMTASAPSAPVTLVIYTGRSMRWVVPGSHTQENPPTLTVQPSGEELPPGALSWRSSGYTLDLTSDEVEQLLPTGSVLVVSSTGDDGSTIGQASYPVERRTL